MRLGSCEKSIFCSLGFTALWLSYAEFSVENIGKTLNFFSNKHSKFETPQGAVFSVHILESMMETLALFQIASTFPENAAVWPVFFADLCNTLKNRDGGLLFSL